MPKYHTCNSNVIPEPLFQLCVCVSQNAGVLRLYVCYFCLCVFVSLHVYTCLAYWRLLKKNYFCYSDPLSIRLVALNHTEESKIKIPDMLLVKSLLNTATHAHTGLREPILLPAFSHFQLVCNSKSLIWRRRNSFANSDDNLGPHL